MCLIGIRSLYGPRQWNFAAGARPARRISPNHTFLFDLDTDINRWKSGSSLLTGRRSASIGE